MHSIMSFESSDAHHQSGPDETGGSTSSSAPLHQRRTFALLRAAAAAALSVCGSPMSETKEKAAAAERVKAEQQPSFGGSFPAFVENPPSIMPPPFSNHTNIIPQTVGCSSDNNLLTSLNTGYYWSEPYINKSENGIHDFRNFGNNNNNNNIIDHLENGNSSPPRIVDVWAHNLEYEFSKIRDLVDRYQYIAMDTEFPGVVAKPSGSCINYTYNTIKLNVDLLKVIQLGITFADDRGCSPPGTSTWQFNFKFDLQRDMYAQDSIDFLVVSGINFQTHQETGIDLHEFGELMISSGLVLNKDVKWISFHGSYDFGYLLKLLTCAPLPNDESHFFQLLRDFFPSLYDIKYLLRSCEKMQTNTLLSSGLSLQRVAEHIDVRRLGPKHQAGSDSLLTCHTFFRLMDVYFDNVIDDNLYSGVIYGLSCPNNNNNNSSSAETTVSTSGDNNFGFFNDRNEWPRSRRRSTSGYFKTAGGSTNWGQNGFAKSKQPRRGSSAECHGDPKEL